MATHLIRFGEYVFGSTFSVSSVPGDSRVDITDIPRRDGAVVSGNKLAGKRIVVRGMLRADTPAALRAAMDDLLAAINAGRQKFYLWDDRFIWATKTTFATDYDETSFKRYCFASIEFICDMALWESDTESLDTWLAPASGGVRNIAVGGNASAIPTFEITVSGSGVLGIEIGLGDSVFALDGEVNDGDIIVVDSTEESVELASYEYDYMSLFDNAFLVLAGNSTNTLSYIKTGGTVNVSQIVTRWRNRWY
jgi:phage-related protein